MCRRQHTSDALPREEREAREAKAVIAQAEHMKRYPDGRLRLGANAVAKLKFKDGGSGGPNRRGNVLRRRIDPIDMVMAHHVGGRIGYDDSVVGLDRAYLEVSPQSLVMSVFHVTDHPPRSNPSTSFELDIQYRMNEPKFLYRPYRGHTVNPPREVPMTAALRTVDTIELAGPRRRLVCGGISTYRIKQGSYESR